MQDFRAKYSVETYAELCRLGVEGKLEEEDRGRMLAQTEGHCDVLGMQQQFLERLDRTVLALECIANKL